MHWHLLDTRRSGCNFRFVYALTGEILPQLLAGNDNPPHGPQPELLASPECGLGLSRVVGIHRLKVMQHEVRPSGIGHPLLQGGFELRNRYIESVQDQDTPRRPALEMLHKLAHRAM